MKKFILTAIVALAAMTMVNAQDAKTVTKEKAKTEQCAKCDKAKAGAKCDKAKAGCGCKCGKKCKCGKVCKCGKKAPAKCGMCKKAPAKK